MNWNDRDVRDRRPRGTVRRDVTEPSGLVAALVVTSLLVIGVLVARQWWLGGQEFADGTGHGEASAASTAAPAGQAIRPTALPAPARAVATGATDRVDSPMAHQQAPARAMPDRGSVAGQDAAALAYAAGRGAADLARPLAQGYADGAMAGFHEVAAQQRAEMRRQQIASIRVTGVMLTARGGYLIVDRDPGSLDDSGAHLCRLAALVAPEPIVGKELIVSVGQPGRPQGVVGSLRC